MLASLRGRYVSVKTAEQQAQVMVFEAWGLFVRLRTQLINALRGQLADYSVGVAQGMVQFRRMIAGFEGIARDLPALVQELCQTYIDQIVQFHERIAVLDKEIKHRAKINERTSRLMTIPPLVHVNVHCRALALCARHRSRPSLHQWKFFSTGVTLQRGAALYPDRNQLVGDKFLAEPPKWDARYATAAGRSSIVRMHASGVMAVIRWAIRKGPPAKLVWTVCALRTQKKNIEFHHMPHKGCAIHRSELGCEKGEGK
jgi:transposase